MNTTNSTSTETIANRAQLLAASMSHGKACYLACREAAIPESEVPATASIVSSILTNREINFSCEQAARQPLTAEQKDRSLKEAHRLEIQQQKSREANARRRAQRESK